MLRVPLLAAAGAALAAAGALLAPAAPALADAAPAHASTATGSDVSYPQCGSALPAREEIAVIGVNAGTGTSTNPCLQQQLAWGDADGALADVYVNTANPGHLASWWPAADLTRRQLPVANPRGACVGAEDAACAYVYGFSIAQDDLRDRGVTAGGQRRWWLDVETMNSWSWNRQANLAVLEGMADAFHAAGASVGIYSTTRQWSLIVGTATPSSPLAGAAGWAAGAVTRGGAEALCDGAAFVPGGSLLMAQWVQGGRDHDTACAPGVTGSTPTLRGTATAGGRLEATPGTWGPAGTALAFQWLRDGAPIGGATATVYSPSADDAGHRLAVRVTGSRAGQPDLVLRSAEVDVDRVPTQATVSADAGDGAPQAAADLSRLLGT